MTTKHTEQHDDTKELAALGLHLVSIREQAVATARGARIAYRRRANARTEFLVVHTRIEFNDTPGVDQHRVSLVRVVDGQVRSCTPLHTTCIGAIGAALSKLSTELAPENIRRSEAQS